MSSSWESIIPDPAAEQKKKADTARKAQRKKEDANRGVRKAVAHSIRVPPSRAVTTPTWEIFGDYLEKLGKDSNEDLFIKVNRLIEATTQFNFLAVRRRVKRNFQFFALAGTNRTIPGRLDQPPIGDEELAKRELAFVEDFYKLLRAAYFNIIPREDWETAQDENFTFNSPVDVNWNALDNTLLKKFWSKHKSARNRAAPVSDRILVFHRGMTTVKARGTFIMDKVDLLVQYIVLDPAGWLYGKLFGKEGKVDITLLLQQSVSGPGDEVLEEDDQEGSARFAAETQAYKKSLEHPNAQTVNRVSLQMLMPNIKSVLRNLLTEMEIQEPAYKDVVVLYRRTVPDKQIKKSDRDPLIECDKEVARRNINVKRFSDIPLADVEMVFPEKRIWLKPIMFIQLAITLIMGIVAGIFTFRTGEALSLSLIATALSLIYGRYAQVMASAQTARQEIQDSITQKVYDQTQDSQISSVNVLLDEIAEKHTKEAMLAYNTLLHHGRPMTKAELDERCEQYLEDRFGEKIDFAIENTLPSLLQDGLIISTDTGLLTAVPLSEAYQILATKWASFFEQDEDSLGLPGMDLKSGVSSVKGVFQNVTGGITKGIGNVGSSISAVMPGFGFARSSSKAASPSSVPATSLSNGGSPSKGEAPLPSGSVTKGEKALPPVKEVQAPAPSVSKAAVAPSTPVTSANVPEPVRVRKRDAIRNFFGTKRKES